MSDAALTNTLINQDVSKKRPGPTNKQRILDTAMKLFGEQGFKATTIRQIGQEAGVAPSLLYRHFRNKKELRDALDTLALDELRGTFEDLKSDEDMGTVVAHYFQATRHLFRYVAQSLLEPNERSVEFQRLYFDAIHMMYRDEQVRGNVRQDLNIEQLSLLGLVNSFGIILFEPLVKEFFGMAPGDPQLEHERREVFDDIWSGGIASHTNPEDDG